MIQDCHLKISHQATRQQEEKHITLRLTQYEKLKINMSIFLVVARAGHVVLYIFKMAEAELGNKCEKVVLILFQNGTAIDFIHLQNKERGNAPPNHI